MTATVLVTGATGAVGPCVVDALQHAGHQVRTFSSRAPELGLAPHPHEARIGDITDPSAVRSAMEGIDAVIHMAALLHVVNPPPGLSQNYEQVNVGGTGTVIEAAIQGGVRRVVFFSTIAVYGGSSGRPLTEESLTQPETLYARTKLAAERIVLDAKRVDGQSIGTVLRFATIYGPRLKGNYRRLLHSLARGRFVPIGDGRNRRTMIYDKDAAQAAVLAARSPEAAGRIYNVSDGDFHTLNEIITAMCRALGRTPPRLHMPLGPVQCVAGILDAIARFGGRGSSPSRAALDKYLEDLVVIAERIRKELGFLPEFNLAAGWRETVADMRKLGELRASL